MGRLRRGGRCRRGGASRAPPPRPIGAAGGGRAAAAPAPATKRGLPAAAAATGPCRAVGAGGGSWRPGGGRGTCGRLGAVGSTGTTSSSSSGGSVEEEEEEAAAMRRGASSSCCRGTMTSPGGTSAPGRGRRGRCCEPSGCRWASVRRMGGELLLGVSVGSRVC